MMIVKMIKVINMKNQNYKKKIMRTKMTKT